jgi:hypothetical protein
LTAVGGGPYVPDGESVWEFGVEKDYKKKANEDFKSRTDTPRGVVRNETTFVFVTPRTWRKESIEEWEEEKRNASDWKDIRVIDGVMLEQWLDDHPSAAARVAREILGAVPRTRARSLAEFWDEYAARLNPALTEQVLLSGRDAQGKELVERLAGEPQEIIVVRADSTDEVIAFVVAAVRHADLDTAKYLEARTLVVDTDDADRELAGRKGTLYIVRGTAVQVAGHLSRRNPTVVPTGRDTPSSGGAVNLNRPSSHDLANGIVTMGIEEDRAFQLAGACGRSVTILSRRIPRGLAVKPDWDDGRPTLIPALLAGGWIGNAGHDQAVICTLAGIDGYGPYEAALQPMLRLQDPPIDREGSVWKMRAPVDAFVHLGYLSGRDHLDRLRAVVTDVFREYDPSLDLPDEKRPFASLEGKQLRHSNWLREGLATTLLLMAALHEEAGLATPGTTPERFVEDLIGQLPGLARDHRVVASLRNELPLLMEAAPRPLLGALERLLEGDGGAMRPIFREGGILSPGSPHTWLLWALEMQAWDPEYLVRVALILARLARVDPGGTIHNRPINTLREIFLPWHPGTNATLEQRMVALDAIIAHEPEVGWKLLVELLPEQQGVAHPTMKPRYREAGASEREVLTWGRVFEGYREAVGRLLSQVDDDPRRWLIVIKAMHRFEPSLRIRARELLGRFINQGCGDERDAIWTALREEVNRHKAFQKADWALKGDELESLEAMVRMLEPGDIVGQVAWLFDEHFPTVPSEEGMERGDALDEVREQAIQRVQAAQGRDGLLALAGVAKLPHLVAMSASSILESIESYEGLIDAALERGEQFDTFAIAVSREAERRFGEEWRGRFVDRARNANWSTEQIAMLLLGWKDDRGTWSMASALGSAVEESYWSRKVPWPLEGRGEDLEWAARKYLGAGRAIAALDAVHRYLNHLSVELVLELLDRALEELVRKPSSRGFFTHFIDEVFADLGRRSDAPVIEVARREYAYLPLLTGQRDRNSLALHRLMTEDPQFFVSVLSDVFKASSAQSRESVTEAQRARARTGYQLLTSFRVVPGARNDQIDGTMLRVWIEAVRRLAGDVDRAQVADQQIGHVLAHAPRDPGDGGWPHRVVREVIEDLSSENVEVGIRIERYNMRGVVGKAMYEGGGQERALAEEARQWATLAAGTPRTAEMLRELARSWDGDAEREDERARQDQMRHE